MGKLAEVKSLVGKVETFEGDMGEHQPCKGLPFLQVCFHIFEVLRWIRMMGETELGTEYFRLCTPFPMTGDYLKHTEKHNESFGFPQGRQLQERELNERGKGGYYELYEMSFLWSQYRGSYTHLPLLPLSTVR